MNMPHTWQFEVIEIDGKKPKYVQVEVNSETHAGAWNELRAAIDDSPMMDFNDVIAISLLSVDQGAVVERPGV